MSVTQEVLDQRVIVATLDELQAYVNEADAQYWDTASQVNVDQVNDLMEMYIPEAPRMAQRIHAIVAGNVLTFAERKYGIDDMHPRLYGGHVEAGVIATYHHAGHPRAVMEDMFRYAAACNQRQPGSFTASELIRFPIMASAHDIIMGNGRGNDERQSALLATEVMMRTAVTLAPDEHTAVAIEATTWDPDKQQQSVDSSRGFLRSQQAICVADLMPLCDRRGPYMTVGLAAEDFCKVRYGRILTKEAKAAGVSLTGASVETCMQLIDERGRLQKCFAKFLTEQCGFYAGYQPADPAVDEYFPGREANVTFIHRLRSDFQAGRVNALGALVRSREFMLAA